MHLKYRVPINKYVKFIYLKIGLFKYSGKLNFDHVIACN